MANLLLSKHSLIIALEAFKMVMDSGSFYDVVADNLDLSIEAMNDCLNEILPILNDDTNAPIVLIPDVGKTEVPDES